MPESLYRPKPCPGCGSSYCLNPQECQSIALAKAMAFDCQPGDFYRLLGDHESLVAAAKLAVALSDTGSPEHKSRFDPYECGEIPPGWRVAEAMREILIDALKGA